MPIQTFFEKSIEVIFRLKQIDPMSPIDPMEPRRSDSVPEGGEWIAQIKWDGVRILTYFDGQAVRLYNRKRHERTLHYPELTDIHTYCQAESVILDGEVIALGADGKPSFYEVMRRDGIRRMEKVKSVQSVVPVSYMIFDIIYWNGEWIHQRSWHERNQLLTSIIKPSAQIQLVPSEADASALFQVIKQHGMEGIVAKRTDSPYLIGKKTDAWLKVKNYRDLIAVIGGFTLSGGTVNALLLGMYDAKGNFRYIGHAGAGKLTREEWRQLTEKLAPLVTKESPFVNQPERTKDAFWIKPMLTAKIMYTEWRKGHSLRQPSIQSFVDIPPKECRIEEELIP